MTTLEGIEVIDNLEQRRQELRSLCKDMLTKQATDIQTIEEEDIEEMTAQASPIPSAYELR